LSHTTRFERDSKVAGFTLIEVLVALAILGMSLMSIGSLVAANVHGTRALAQHLSLVSVARALENGLPDPLQNEAGPMTGVLDGHPWRVDVVPFSASSITAPQSSPWLPQAVTITVSSPSSARFRLDTVRLRRRTEQ
jgi:general secretion pathway protein I